MPSNTILIVEDNADLSDIFSKVFIHAGYQAVPVTTLANARAIFDAHHYEVLVIDTRLPDGDGIDFLRERWASLQARGTSVIVVTAEDQYQDACTDLGVEFFLIKPVLPDMLVSLIRRLRARAAA
jgi:DNA-binding response OmpR family regulator